MTTAFFQWTLKASWLATLLSVLTSPTCITGIAYPTSLTYRISIVRHENIAAPYTEEPHFPALGALYAAYRLPRWFQFTIYLAASFIRSCFISLGHAHGFIQVIGLVVVELLIFGTSIIFRPGHTRGSDGLSLFLSIVRISTIAALMLFVKRPTLCGCRYRHCGCVQRWDSRIFCQLLYQLGDLAVSVPRREERSAKEGQGRGGEITILPEWECCGH